VSKSDAGSSEKANRWSRAIPWVVLAAVIVVIVFFVTG